MRSQILDSQLFKIRLGKEFENSKEQPLIKLLGLPEIDSIAPCDEQFLDTLAKLHGSIGAGTPFKDADEGEQGSIIRILDEALECRPVVCRKSVRLLSLL